MNRFKMSVDQQKALPRRYFQVKAPDLKTYEALIDKVMPSVKRGDLRLLDYDGKFFVLWLSGGFRAPKALKDLPEGVQVSLVKGKK